MIKQKPKSRAKKQPAAPAKRRKPPEREPERMPPTVFDRDGPDYDAWDLDDRDLRNRW